MDIYSERKFFIFLIIVLFVLNLAAISALFYQNNTPLPPPPNSNEKPAQLRIFLRHELNLTREQMVAYRKSRQNHKLIADNSIRKMSKIKEQLKNEIFSEKPNEEKIKELTSQIGKLQAKLEEAHFTHFKEVYKICNTEQKEKLIKLYNEMTRRSNIKFRTRRNQNQMPNVNPENNIRDREKTPFDRDRKKRPRPRRQRK